MDSVIFNPLEEFEKKYKNLHSDNTNKFYMNIRKLFWTEEGWPITSPERYAGEIEQEIEEHKIPGEWEFIILYRDLNRVIDSKTVILDMNESISGEFTGTWNFNRKDNIEIKLNIINKIECFTGKISVAWDWELSKPTIILTGINNIGIPLFGKRIN